MKEKMCVNGACQFRSIAGLLTSLLRLAKVWHTEQVNRGLLTDEDWEKHYGEYISQRLAPYLTSLQSHNHNAPVVLNSFDYSTPEERAGSYDPRFAIPSPASVGAEYTGTQNYSKYHVG